MYRRVIAALGVLALVAASCSSSSTPERAAAKPGQIVTVLSSGKDGLRNPYGGDAKHHQYDSLAVDGRGNVFVDDDIDEVVLKVPRQGKVTAVAACKRSPAKGLSKDVDLPSRCTLGSTGASLAANAEGTLYLVYYNAGEVSAISPKGEERTIAGTGDAGPLAPVSGRGPDVDLLRPRGPAIGSDGNLYFSNGNNVVRIDRDLMLTTVAGPGAPGPAGATGPLVADHLGFDGAGNLYAAVGVVYKIDANGAATPITGGAGSAPFTEGAVAAKTLLPYRGMAVDKAGNVFLSLKDADCVVRVGTDGLVRTVAGTGQAGLSGDGGPATAAQLNIPTALAVDADGNLYIADGDNGRVRMVGAERR